MRRLIERKYLVLLLTLTVLVVAFPILRSTPGTRVIFEFALSLVFLAALFAVFTDRKLRVVAVLLGVPTLVGIWTGYLLPGIPRLPLEVSLQLLAALFFGFTIVVILRDIYREKGVTSDSVYGAFCGYLLAGLAFGHLFCLVGLLDPGSFQGASLTSEMPEGRRHFLLTYFSFLTLTTVGYGDIVPVSDAARGLAVVEAVVGQFYIAVLVAEIIGKRVSQSFAPREPEPKPDNSASTSSTGR